MTAQEAIQKALSSITLAAQQSDKDYPYDSMNLSSTLPVAEIVKHGFSSELVDGDADSLPRLLVRSNKGLLEVERCPFAPLALLSSDNSWDGAEIAGILQNSGITSLKLDDFVDIPDWYGMPAIAWLFPERLSEALFFLDALRQPKKA